RVEVIPHGDESALVRGEPVRPSQCEPLAVFFGSLSRYKGLDVLLDAHARVLDTLPGARLLIAGSLIPDLDVVELRRRCAALSGVTLQVGYVPIDDVAALVGSARVIVAPYRRSNASGVVRLAQTLGRPVVVTDVGDLSESVDDGETGLVVAVEDSASLAQAMVRILDDGTLADRMGKEGRQRLLATASWPLVAQRVSDIYGQLLGRRERAVGGRPHR
ncbi:MAG: glycosyltransferase family 4 protein, partial [Actinomycetota bacterium]|nr:glycosyltransferase family 4 protein [Actinomycetota bacterium]